MSTLTEYCLPFVKVGGQFVSYKSGNVDNELKESSKAIKILGGEAWQGLQFRFAWDRFCKNIGTNKEDQDDRK